MNKPTGCHKSTCTMARRVYWTRTNSRSCWNSLVQRLGCIKQVDIHVSFNTDFEFIKNQPINSLYSQNYKMIVSLDAYKFYPFCSLIEITDNKILRNMLHIFFFSHIITKIQWCQSVNNAEKANKVVVKNCSHVYTYCNRKLRCISFLWKHLTTGINSHDMHVSQLLTCMSVFKHEVVLYISILNLFSRT